jgi:hypothetical protein
MKKSIEQIRLKGDLFARVRQVRPLAREILRHGLSYDSPELPNEFIPCAEPSGLSDRQMSAFNDSMDAVFVVGIAVGLLLRPEAFERGPR